MTAEPAKNGFVADFKRFFVRGLATLLPTVLTIVLLFKCFEFVQDYIGVHLSRGLIYVAVWVVEDYPNLTDDEIADYLTERGLSADESEDANVLRQVRRVKLNDRWSHGPRSLVGFGLAIALVYIAGRLLGSFLGRRFWQVFEGMVQQVPLFNQVYPYIKQVTDYLFGANKIQFSRVVAIPYPRKELYSVGLVTGAGFRHVGEVTKENYLTVFIPSSPTPVTGYVVYVRKDEVIDLPITIEEAFRFAVSGGVIVPERQALPSQLTELESHHTATQAADHEPDDQDASG